MVNLPMAPWAHSDIEMEDTRLFTSTELTVGTGCTRKALRYYQQKGLLTPVRTIGNRRYDEVAFNRLRLIVNLRDVGLSIEEIQQIVMLYGAAGSGPAAPVAEEMSGQLGKLVEKVSERIETLRHVRNRLVTARETMIACRECSEPLESCKECATTGRLDPTSRALMAGQ